MKCFLAPRWKMTQTTFITSEISDKSRQVFTRINFPAFSFSYNFSPASLFTPQLVFTSYDFQFQEMSQLQELFRSRCRSCDNYGQLTESCPPRRFWRRRQLDLSFFFIFFGRRSDISFTIVGIRHLNDSIANEYDSYPKQYRTNLFAWIYTWSVS